MDHQITDIEFRPANYPNNLDMIGWVSCVFNGMFLNNIKVKRLFDKLVLSYPRYTRGSNERSHFYFNPVTREARLALDDAIFTYIREVHRTCL